VNIVNGNKFQEVVDYESAGRDRLRFARYYNSQSRAFSSLGFVWRSNFDRKMVFPSGPTGGAAILERPDGRFFKFHVPSGQSVWVSDDSDVDGALTTDGSTVWVFKGPDDSAETYDFNGGRLLSIRSQSGYQQNLLYDTNGNLQSVTDSYNRQLIFTYSTTLGNSVVQTLTDPDGRVYTYAYNSVQFGSDLLANVTYPGTTPNPTVQYAYESTQYGYALTGIIDENGNRFATWAYDGNLRATSSQHAGGAESTSIVYNADGSITVTNALGKAAIYRFAPNQNVQKLVRIDGQASTHCAAASAQVTYDSNGYVASRTDWNGNVTTFVNDSRGMVLSRTEASGTPQARTTAYTWLPNFHLPTQIVEPGRTTTFTYDTNGFLLTKTQTDTTTGTVPYSTNGRTRSWTYTYTAAGLPATVKGPRTDVNDTVTFGYDSSGTLVSVTNPLGQVTHVTAHDSSGRPQTIVDPNGVTSNLAYDSRGRFTSATVVASSGNATIAFAYDNSGNVTRITRPDGSFLAYNYDMAHRVTKVANALGETINYTLDALGGRTLLQIQASGGSLMKTQSQVFDELGRLLQSVGASGQTTTLVYDNDNNVTSTTDPLSHATGRSFDALNRLIQVNAPLSVSTAYGYDQRGNLVSVTDPRGLPTTYVFDGLDNLIQVASPDTGTTVFVVDDAGNRVQQTDAAGIVTQFSYDVLNRLMTKSFPAAAAENASYHYDESAAINGVGRLTSVADQSGSTAYIYDVRGNVVQETRVISGSTFVTLYTYDLADRVSEIVYPSGRIVDYARDAAGQTTGITTRANNAASPMTVVSGASYKPFGPLSALTYGNGLSLSIGYDLDYQPSSRIVSGTATVQNLTYSFDSAGNVGSITDNIANAQNQTLQYDALNRLTQGTRGSGTWIVVANYQYDSVGNRLSVSGNGSTPTTLTYAASSNQLQSVLQTFGTTTNNRSITYNPVGSVIGETLATGTTSSSYRTYAYDHSNRLIQSTAYSSNPTTYGYNFLGQRVIKTPPSPASAIVFHYDRAGRLLAESAATGAQTWRERIWLDDVPVGFVSGGTLYFTHPDHLGTPKKITDVSQNVVWSSYLGPFGDGQAGPNGLTENLRLPGQYFDGEDQLHYNYFRDYDPSIGRYIESDPIGLAGGINTYAYVGGNPLSRVDPHGLASCTYSISSHTLTCAPDAGGDPAALGPNGVWSGVGPCANDPGCASHNEIGPIVPGNYNMNQDDRPGHEGFWRLEPNPKIPGWKCRLGLERCGFELHPGGISLGCITADKKNQDAMTQYQNVNGLLNRENGNNRLRVVP